MPMTQDGDPALYYESTGDGAAIVFVHEFAGDHRSWEPQVRFFGRRFRCITFNARGYPPSDVPAREQDYSQANIVSDIARVMRAANVARAHIVGLSMGGYAALNFGLEHPEMTRSLVICSAGHGSDPALRAAFLAHTDAMAARMLDAGMDDATRAYRNGDVRRLFKAKDPRGFDEANGHFISHCGLGSAMTARGYQMRRSTIYELGERMAQMDLPTLIVAGDHDDPCLEPALFMKRTIAGSRLWVMPHTTHALNLEEPDAFNRGVLDFLTETDARATPDTGEPR